MSKETKITILGHTGYLGSNLYQLFKENNHNPVGISSQEFNLLNFDQPYSKDIIDSDIIINCAAMTNEDLAETDIDYRLSLYIMNTLLPVLLPLSTSAYFIHICSFFSRFHWLCDYNLSKRISDEILSLLINNSSIKNTLMVYAGWFYGGINSKQFDSIVKNNQDKHLVIDNHRISNPTNMTWFCKKLYELIIRKTCGQVAIYNKQSMTAESFSKNILNIWSDHWIADKYNGDLAQRPQDATMQKCIPQKILHITE